MRDALEDDLNTPLALTHLHELAGAINRTTSDAERSALQRALEAGGQLMGLLGQPPLEWLQGSAKADAERIEQRIATRTAARRQRHFGEADRIRAELAAEGILLEDRLDGTTTWWRKRLRVAGTDHPRHGVREPPRACGRPARRRPPAVKLVERR